MKKVIVLFLSVLLIFGFSACSGGGDISDPNNITGGNSESESATESRKVLVVYFSATNNTERVAEVIAEETGGDLFEIVPKKPYTAEDLEWTNSESRVYAGHEDESKRKVKLEKTTPDKWRDYDTVFIGYPIWWGIAAWPVSSFVSANNFKNKTVIPFCTSSTSGVGDSADLLKEEAGTGKWFSGVRFQSHASKEAVCRWIDNLSY